MDSYKMMLADMPEALDYWEGQLQAAAPESLRMLFEAVDDSPFALVDWVEGLRTLNDWLAGRGLELKGVEAQIGYVCCSAEAAGAAGQMSHLPALVADFLEVYGCERAVKK